MPWTTNSTRRCIRAPVVAISQVRASSISRHRTATPRMASQRPRRMALMMATVCERVLGAGAYAHIGNKEGALPLVYIARRKKYLLAGMYRASCSPSATTRKRARESACSRVDVTDWQVRLATSTWPRPKSTRIRRDRHYRQRISSRCCASAR